MERAKNKFSKLISFWPLYCRAGEFAAASPAVVISSSLVIMRLLGMTGCRRGAEELGRGGMVETLWQSLSAQPGNRKLEHLEGFGVE